MTGSVCARLGVAAAAACVLAVGAPSSAAADLGSLKAACSARDAADGDTSNGSALPFLLCDDGVPPVGGTTPNPGAAGAVAVPERYGGFAGLPPKVAPDPGSGADTTGEIALDVDVSLPDPRRLPPPRGGYPLMVLMHTCCAGDKHAVEADTVDAAGENWHYSNAWYASRGYVVLNYTSRGFVDASGRGSTGVAELDSRNYEVNDYQYLACRLAADPFFKVDPRKVVVSGGSYGGALAALALTDPTWSCREAGHPGLQMRLAAAAPKYSWSDLAYSLVPNGSQLRDGQPPTDPARASTRSPFGFPKHSIVLALYATGTAGQPPSESHTTFPGSVRDAVLCLDSSDPYEQNPLCGGLFSSLLDQILRDSSAYYQNDFFDGLGRHRIDPVPLFSAGSLGSPLFPLLEHRRMVERLRSAVPGYPVQEYYGDYGDFTQNKAKEWADLCGTDRHPCRRSDYPRGDLNSTPPTLVRLGVTTRLERFVDHYARPPGDAFQPTPAFDVTTALKVCPANASGEFPAGEPGQRFTEPSFAALARQSLRLQASGDQTTTSHASPNPHAASSDPIANFARNGGRCPVETVPAGPGVASYDLGPLGGDATVIGRTRVTVSHSGSGNGVQLDARLYDLYPDGTQVMVDRGPSRLVDPNGTTVLDLDGTAWRFAKGHRLRVELAQDDDPYVKSSTQPSSLTLKGVTLDLPLREGGPGATLRAPRLASDQSSGRRFALRLAPSAGEQVGIRRYELEVRRHGRRGPFRMVASPAATSGPLGPAVRYAGRLGGTYDFRVRPTDTRGVPGPWASARTIVPYDDFRHTPHIRYRGRWTRPRVRGAYQGRVSRSSRRGARMSFRFRGGWLYLIGRTGPRGGRALVILDGRRRVVDFYSRRARNRVVVVSRRLRGRGIHRVVMRNLGRKRRPSRGTRVEIDAIGVLAR